MEMIINTVKMFQSLPMYSSPALEGEGNVRSRFDEGHWSAPVFRVEIGVDCFARKFLSDDRTATVTR